tara:strand:- start:8744 stop:9025 length:282 start_codon:yes stop_codon:yes gene_type:complete
MNHFSEEMPYAVYSEAELKQKREVAEALPDKMAEYLAKGGGIYTAVHGETHDKYVMGHCATPNKEKSDKKVRVEISINAESAERYSRLREMNK